jgi:hypothetical protein
MEALAGLLLGWLLRYGTEPVPVPHVIDYEPKQELMIKYNPKDDCKEGIVKGNVITCEVGYPRVVQSTDGFLETMNVLIDTRSELKKCNTLIEMHNEAPMSYKRRF